MNIIIVHILVEFMQLNVLSKGQTKYSNIFTFMCIFGIQLFTQIAMVLIQSDCLREKKFPLCKVTVLLLKCYMCINEHDLHHILLKIRLVVLMNKLLH